MPFSPADSTLFSPLFGEEKMAAIFSDDSFVRTLLQVEAALARVQSELGVIPAGAGERITAAAADLDVDTAALRAAIDKAGVPVAELVRQLRTQVDGEAASYVHWGATTQDVMDTALVLQIRDALDEVAPTLERLMQALAPMARRHRHTLMAGRTHSQQALPIPFGLKVAGWLAPLLRHRRRLSQLKPRLLLVQFGGAAGTLASLGDDGVRVQEALAAELELGLAPMPWHTQRDALAELAGWLSLVSGSLAKMAQDVILLAQSEVGEVGESADPSRGGSSTMPQKRNPVVSEIIVAAARSNAAALASMHQAMIQEHERATHGWQLEWLNLPHMFALTATALNKACFLAENLVVDEGRMRQNVKASKGLMMAEALSLALSATMPRAQAKEIVAAACRRALAQDRHLVDVVQEQTGASLDWNALRDEAAYLGSSQQFIDRVLDEVESIQL